MSPKLLGDPHLGRVFTTGVPMNRRGEREKLVREDFLRQLDPAGASVHICMGDLFDAPQVSYKIILFAADAYINAAGSNPNTLYVIIQGNHDDSRDLTEVTAWDVFCRLMEAEPGILCVREPVARDNYLFLPWSPNKTALDQLADAGSNHSGRVAYGHWDTDPRSASHNLIPTKELAALGITKAYTGHVHKPGSFKRDGVEVEIVGSMQPYAQGEDGGQSSLVRYETLTLEQLADNEDLLVDVCVRLRLQPGEQPPETIPDCRSFAIERVSGEQADDQVEVSLEGFDTDTVARRALDERDIIPEVRVELEKKWSETFGRVLGS